MFTVPAECGFQPGHGGVVVAPDDEQAAHVDVVHRLSVVQGQRVQVFVVRLAQRGLLISSLLGNRTRLWRDSCFRQLSCIRLEENVDGDFAGMWSITSFKYAVLTYFCVRHSKSLSVSAITQ